MLLLLHVEKSLHDLVPLDSSGLQSAPQDDEPLTIAPTRISNTGLGPLFRGSMLFLNDHASTRL
jgi:hypothetical protein